MSAMPVMVTVSGAGPFLTSNRLPRNEHVLHRRQAAWRAAGLEAHRALLHRDPWARMQVCARLDVVVIRATQVRADADNVQPSAKPARDGAIAAGLLPDDDDTHLLLTTYARITIPRHPPALRMIWTPLELA